MIIFVVIPGLSLRSNPGLKLANAFGVVGLSFNVYQYLSRAKLDAVIQINA